MLPILSAVVWVDFFTMLASKYIPMGRSLNKWYDQFGIVAVASDCLIIVLGILLAKILFPSATGWNLVLFAVIIQLIHDVVFFFFIVKPLPTGTNRMIDLFKEYGAENGWKILAYDSFMMASTVLLADVLEEHGVQEQSFVGLLGVYALTYMLYTKNL
jgi:ABC-type enterochelin transport system permease subunit